MATGSTNGTQPPAQRQRRSRAAVAAGTAAVVAPVVGAGVTDAAAVNAAATVKQATGSILATFISFLGALSEQHKAWLASQLSSIATSQDDVGQVMAEEMVREQDFAKLSADRVAKALPAALSIADPAERRRAIEKIFAAEERYAQQRAEAMAARAIHAVQRASLRRASPRGAYWQLGQAHKHTEGCLIMAGRFWPWTVLDRVHPPRHYGCTSTLHSEQEAMAAGWINEHDIPSVKVAVRAAAGVMQEGVADALLRELEIREWIAEVEGVDMAVLESIELQGVRDGTAEAV